MLIRTHKISFIAFVLFMLSMPVFSQKDTVKYRQTNKGKFLAGLNGMFYTDKHEVSQNKTLMFQLNPRIGYFLFRNFAVGLDGTYIYRFVNNNYYKEEYTSNELLGGPFVRYYLRYRNHGLFGEVAYSYGKQEEKDEYLQGNKMEVVKLNTLSSHYSVGLGYCYFVTKNVSLELVYKYQKSTTLREWYIANDVVTFPANKAKDNSVTLGLQFYF